MKAVASHDGIARELAGSRFLPEYPEKGKTERAKTRTTAYR